MGRLIGFAGAKQSGKSTSGSFLVACELLGLGLIQKFKFNNDGQLFVVTNDKEGLLDLAANRDHPFYVEHVFPYVKIYSFADALKQMCMSVWGLTFDQCYGAEQDKNSLTECFWEDQLCNESWMRTNGFKMKSRTPMTARQVLQHWGTNLCRRVDDSVWTRATIRKIQQDETDLAIVTDVRFPNEVQAIQKVGGKVIRLLRNPYPGDNHPSERALDGYNGFDAIIDNSEMSIGEAHEAIYHQMADWGMVNYTVDETEEKEYVS